MESIPWTAALVLLAATQAGPPATAGAACGAMPENLPRTHAEGTTHVRLELDCPGEPALLYGEALARGPADGAHLRLDVDAPQPWELSLEADRGARGRGWSPRDPRERLVVRFR